MNKNVLHYRDFIGSVNFASEDEVFYGKVLGIDDLITFEGESVKDLKQAFQYMIDEHVKDCEKENKPIKKSYSGNFNVRLTPGMHRKLAEKAYGRGLTLNQLVKNAIKKELELE